MAQFDESKVINALHADKAEVGKMYWCSDYLRLLKKHIEENNSVCVGELKSIKEGEGFCIFCVDNKSSWNFLYPYEEPPKQRMTCRQLAEWLAKGNGEFSDSYNFTVSYFTYSYSVEKGDKEVADVVKIRSWDSEEWIEPTVDIYERDCK